LASAGGIRAGAAYVEIFAKDGAFQQAMSRVQSKMATVAQSLQRFGTGMSLGGAALGAPLVLAARQAAGFEDALLGMKGAAGLGVADVAKLGAEAKKLGSSLGISPTTIAQSFLELAKAGMSVADVLDGAGKSAVEFAKISGVEADRAATFMKTSMNVFGVSSQEAVDTLTAAANSSETSIEALVESFSQASSTGESFNQSLFGLSQAFAVLAGAGIVGEEAGTAVKTMLTKLVAPTQDAEEALGRLGLKISDFRDEAGQLLPMQQVAGVFEKALGGMAGDPGDFMASQQALVDVFEQRGIKVITAFANAGEEGFGRIAREMAKALPVSQQFQIQMSGISGQFSRLKTGVELISIAFGEAISGSLQTATTALFDIMTWVAKLITQFPELAVLVTAVAAGMAALGTAAIATALAMKGIAVVGVILAALASPAGGIALAVVAVAGLAAYMTGAFEDLEGWAMRLKAVWAKLGLWIRAAFDQNFFATGLQAALKKVDEDFAKWEAGRKEKKDKGAPAANASKPDNNRDPMKDDPLAARERAAELAKEEADAEQDMTRAISQQTDAYFKAIKKAEEFGDAGKAAADEYFAGLAKLQEQLLGGVLNTTSYGQAAEALGDQFAGQLEAMRESERNRGTGLGPSLGGFGVGGGAGGIGIGPELNPIADATKQTAANTAVAANALQQIVAGQGAMGGPMAGPAAVGAPIAGGAFAGGAAAPMAAAVPAAAASAEAGTQITAGFLKLGEHMTRLRNTMAVAMTTNNQLTATSNAFLERIAYKMEKSGAAFL
jgi:TP901 family phage tail tape measure protein